MDRTAPRITPEELRALAERCLETAISRPEFVGAYSGPLWETPLSPSPGRSAEGAAWKCAVLRRRETGGADHWGHLFLVTPAAEAGVEIAVSSPLGSAPATPTRYESIRVSDPKVTASILSRPLTASSEEKLFALAATWADVLREELRKL